MLDMRLIRERPEEVREALARRGRDAPIDELRELDGKRRRLISEAEEIKRRKNEASKRVRDLKRQGKDAGEIIERQKRLSREVKELDAKVGDISDRLAIILSAIPNIPHISVPSGGKEHKNSFVRSWGDPRAFDFEPKPHWEVGRALGMLDFEAAARMSGSHFPLYMGMGAKLERALYGFMLDLHVKEHGYTEIIPPYMVKRESMFGTGQLPKMEDDMYRCEVDDLFLIPTAEVPLVNMHRGEIIDDERLPLNYVSYTPCFRREAGSYGKETRGLMRVHQFDKVEMVSFTRPSESYDALERMLGHAEDVLRALGLPYRVWALCAEEISFASSKTYDIEVWAPGVGRWLEVASISNCEAFQARRAGIRCRRKAEKGTYYPHTLNGSGVALARTFLSICENYQQADGSLRVPEALVPYMDGVTVIE